MQTAIIKSKHSFFPVDKSINIKLGSWKSSRPFEPHEGIKVRSFKGESLGGSMNGGWVFGKNG